MDITKSNSKITTSKYINGETVNYSAMFLAVTFAFLCLKQILKLGFSVSADIAIIVSSVVSLIGMFFLEKKFVFNHRQSKNVARQIIMYGLCSVVCFGFYFFFEFIFSNLLKLEPQTVYLATGVAVFFFKYYFDRILVFEVGGEAKNNKNGRAYKLFFDNRFVFLSIALATVGIMFIYLIFQLFPFGDKTVLRMDLYHQYGPLFAELYDRLIGLKSFLYSWESGGGSSFLGNYFNYLSSPLSILILLFDRKQIAFAITMLVALKGVLSAGSFSFFIKHSLKSHSYASSAFGVFYAFSAYFLAYYWNIMWIDGMMLLPIIALGIERIINKGKPVLYIASLSIMLYSSYYIGYMICIFSILYFLVFYFVTCSPSDVVKNRKFKGFKKLLNNKFINRGLIFAGSSVLVGALCACFLIPTYFILQQCSATSDSFPALFESYFNLINLLSSHLAGIETTIRSSGDDVLPNIYCGILTVILVPLFVMNKEIRLKEKILYLLLVVFFVFSFDNNYANFIWHALHFPNDLPYRFSFMYCFVVLIIAYKSLQKIKAIRYQDIAVVGMIWALIALYFQANPTNKISEPSIYISLAFIAVWTGVLLMIKKGVMNKFVIGVTIIAMTFCEVIVANSNSYLFTQNNKPYVANYDDYREAIEKTYAKDDKELYRTELCNLMTRMDPCLYGYNGMSTFSSMAYEEYSRTQYSLGMFGNRINSYTYNTQTPVYNMMFAVKYLMNKDNNVLPSKEFYSLANATDNYNVEVYKNDYYLPIAYETSIDLKDWVVEEGNPFEAQEDFVDYAAGVNGVFTEVQYTDLVCENIEADDVTENGTYNFYKESDDSDYGNISINLTPNTNGNVYVYITSPTIDNVNYYWGEEDTTYQNIDEPYIMDLGVHNKGDDIRIELDCSKVDSGSYFEIYAYSVNLDVFASAYDMLKAGAIKITNYSETEIIGTINAGYDGLLYTSIPYDDGWSIYIDGEKQDTFEVGNAMLASTLSEGTHEVRLKYSPKGINYGIVISAAAWCCIAAYFAIRKIFSKKKFV